MKKFLALTLSAALMLSLAACGGGTTGDDAAKDNAAATGVAIEGDTIKIGVFEPTTGENGGGGMQEVLGMRYANKVNPTVDINGTTYKIQLVEVDNQSDKTAAVTAAQSLISSGVVAVLGSYGSGVSIAAGQTFADAQVPAIGASCTNPQVTLGNDFYFRTCFLDPFQGTVMASYAIEKGYKTAALVSQNGDDYSTGLAAFFKQAFEGMGGTIVADETYQTNESDFNAILTTIKGANPDCIFAPSSIATATLLLPQAQANGIKAQSIASDTWENETIITAAGSAAEGVALSTFFDEHDESNPVAKEFVEGFKAYLNGDPQNLTLNGGSDG
ncbi:MAG TPA: amino acid ABC transporter substrate-binding protein, partial [Clostridium sp.]|nr:amino acid ABC transporter substrate-binding protein [Clostridium sp.]